MTNKKITAPITREKGIIQGCPYSVIAFEIGIDKWIRWIENYSTLSSPSPPIQGYVDDVVFMSTDHTIFSNMFKKTEQFMNGTSMNIKQRKCGILSGKRSGNNWKNNVNIEINCQNDIIPVFEKEQSYKYLGHEINISNSAEAKQIQTIVSDFKSTLDKISNCPLPNSAKVQAISIMCISKLNFYFYNICFPEYILKDIENAIVEKVRLWFDLNDSTTRSFMFTPQQQGGLGIPKPYVNYYACRLSFILTVLNSDDMCFRKGARDSLKLHMERRKVPMAEPGQSCFAGYSVVGNKLNKKSSVNWPKSFWINIF